MSNNIFSTFLFHNHESANIIQSKTDKEQNFSVTSIKNWNARRNGIPFSNRAALRHNQILFVDFGFGYKPELAYSHPALLLGYENNLCKVLPITSNSALVSNAYHPTIRPNGNGAYYLIPFGTCALSKNSVVQIRQFRTISESRIIKIIDPQGLPIDMYKDIRFRAFKDCFNEFAYKIQSLDKEVSKLKKEIFNLRDENK